LELGGFENKSALLDKLVSIDVISKTDRDRMARDAWDRDFIWRETKVGTNVVIRILSVGPNGVFEDGRGDDLCVEITFPPDDRPAIVLNGINRDY